MATQRYSVEVKSLGAFCGTYWYREGTVVLHRVGGPAVEYADGGKCWYLNGKRVTQAKHKQLTAAPVEYADGRIEWYLDGKTHREDGPAIEYADGTKHWYLDGKRVTQAKHKQLTAAPVEEMTMAQLEAALGKRIKIIK